MKISRQRAVYASLLFALIMLAGILLRQAIQEYLVMPVALLLWILNRISASVDQTFYWFGLILVIVFITLFWFTTGPMDQAGYLPVRNSALEAMDRWRVRILSTRDQTDEKNYLKQELANLLKAVYASKQPNLAPWQIGEAIERGEIRLPDSIRAFLMLDPPERPSLVRGLRRILLAPGRWARHWSGHDVRNYYASIAEVIAFLEKKLESEDDE